MNNGFTTAPFTLGGGIRQGDPPSAYHFTITLEALLAEWMRSNSKLQGFRIVEEMVKLSLFANDMNCFLRDKDSYMLFQLLEHFSDYSC